MKTTIDVADTLFRQAKKLAAKRGITFREVVETALRKHLAEEREPRPPFRLRTHTFKGRGVQPGVDLRNWGQIMELAYGYDECRSPKKRGE